MDVSVDGGRDCGQARPVEAKHDEVLLNAQRVQLDASSWSLVAAHSLCFLVSGGWAALHMRNDMMSRYALAVATWGPRS